MLLVLVLFQTSACTDDSDTKSSVAALPICSTPGQVKQVIHNGGYANVTQIHQVENGWEAAATLGGAPVKLTVDNQCYKVRVKE